MVASDQVYGVIVVILRLVVVAFRFISYQIAGECAGSRADRRGDERHEK